MARSGSYVDVRRRARTHVSARMHAAHQAATWRVAAATWMYDVGADLRVGQAFCYRESLSRFNHANSAGVSGAPSARAFVMNSSTLRPPVKAKIFNGWLMT